MLSSSITRRAATLQALCITLATALVLTLLPALPVHASDPDPRIDDLEAGLLALAHALDRGGELGALAETIPLTVATPGTLAGLDASVVQASLFAALVGVPADSDMDAFLDALDGTHIDAEGVEASFTVAQRDGADDERGDLFFDLGIQINRTVDVPLFFDEGIEDPELEGGLPTLFLRQGQISDVETVLDGTFKVALHVQPGETVADDLRSFEIRDPAAAGFTVSVEAEGGIADFLARYGITDVDATATADELDLVFTADLTDPGASGTGTVTQLELTTTNPLDLFAISAGGSMNLALELNQTALLADHPGFDDADERITLAAAGAAGSDPVFPDVVADIGARLEPFGNLTPDDVLVGLGEAALATRAASGAGDVDLPLITGALPNPTTGDPGGKLLEFVRERAEVLIFCGSTDSAPPQGVARDGGIAYCQAFANENAETGSVAWTLSGDPDPSFQVPANPDTTLGVDPTATVRVSTDRIRDLRVTWEDPDADPEDAQRSGVPRFETVQQLADDLVAAGYTAVPAADLLGVTEVDGIGGPDSPIDVVTLDLSTTLDDPVELEWRVGDSLRQRARLSSVGDDGEPPTATAAVAGVLNMVLGIVLDPSLPGPGDEPSVANQELVEKLRGRFLVTDRDDDLIEITSFAFSDAQTLPGRVGFLPVEVDLALDIGPGALTVGIDPITALADDPTGVAVQRPTGSDGWVRVADLIPYLDPYAETDNGEEAAIPPRRGFDAEIDLAATVDVSVSDRMGESAHSSGFALDESFTATWTAVATAPAGEPEAPLRTRVPRALTISDDADFAAYSTTLRPFDVAPEVRGVATGGDDTTLEADVDFPAAFGVAAGTELDATLTNVTQGGTCRGFTVQASSLVCDDPLPPPDLEDLEGIENPGDAQGDPIEWQAGDEFLVEGDLDALRRLATRALLVGAGGLSLSENPALFASLPQLQLRAADLVPLEALAAVLDEFAVAVETEQGESHFAHQTPGEPDVPLPPTDQEVVLFPATAPDLPRLVDALHDVLTGHEDLALEGPGSRDVAVGVDVTAIDDVQHLVLDVELTDTGRTVNAPIRLATEEHGAIVEDGSATVDVEYDAGVTVSVGVPLAHLHDPRDIVIVHDTEVTVALAAEEGSIEEIKLVVGGVAVEAGEGIAVVAGEADDPSELDPPIDPTTTLFDDGAEFLERGVVPGAEVRLYEGDDVVATCVVAEGGTPVTADTVRCAEALAPVDPPEFTQGASYDIIDGAAAVVADGTVGDYGDPAAAELDPTIDLFDPAGPSDKFDDVDAGDQVRLYDNGDVAATCIVDAVQGTDVVRCEAPLQSTAPPITFDEGDPYEIDVVGVGTLGLRLDVDLRHPDPGASAPEDFFDEVVGTWAGTDTDACDGPHSACLELSLRVEDDDGRVSALGTLEYALPDDFTTSVESSDAGAAFDPPVPLAVLPASAVQGLGLQPLDFFNVATAGTFLDRLFEDAFDGKLNKQSIPLIGTQLHAGAPIVGVFANLRAGLQGGLDGQTDSLGDSLETALETSSPPDYKVFIEDHIKNFLDGFIPEVEASYRIDDENGPPLLDIEPEVEVDCSADPCELLFQVTDVRIDFTFAVGADATDTIGIGCDDACVLGESLAFDPGIAGLPLVQPPGVDPEGDGPIQAGHRWNLGLAIGLSKAAGPYLAPRGGGNGTADLTLGAFGLFTDIPEGETNPDCVNKEGIFGPGASAAEFAGKIGFPLGERPRCGEALIGILPGRVYDGDGTSDQTRRSAVEALVTVTAAAGVVGFGALLDERRAPVAVAHRARLNLLFESNAGDLYASVFGGDAVGAMPAVVGTFHAYEDAPGGHTPLYFYQALAFDPLPFLREFLGPVANTIKDLTDPFSTMLETISTPIPVVSELSELVGGDPVTMLSLLEAVSGNDLEMVRRLIEAVKFANEIAGIVGNDLLGFVPLGPGGANQLDGINLDTGGSGADPDWVLTVPLGGEPPDIKGGGFFVEIADGKPGIPKEAKKGDEKKAGKKEPTELFKKKVEEDGKKLEAKATWSGAALTTPVLDDPDEVFGMLIGKDAVLVRFDAGVLKASFEVSWTFGPFAAGPVLFDIGIGLSIGLEGRFALGFDTYGFSRVVRGGRSFISPFVDGLYLDGYDAQGKNVDEVKLITTVKGSAAVSLYIIRAGLELAVKLTISLDLIDPRGDGRVRIEDIHRFRNDPICLFIVKGKLGFAVSVFIEINLIIKKIKKSWTIWELKPELDLFEVSCDPPVPVFGSLNNPVPGAGWLPSGAWNDAFKLRVGPLASQRGIFPDEADEHFVVRQRSALNGVDISSDARDQLEKIGIKNTAELGGATEGTIIEIEAFGETLLYALPRGTVLHAETGGGNDTILLEPGTELPIIRPEDPPAEPDDEDEETFDFVIPAWIEAGGGSNRFDGGDGGNVLIGSGDNDTLKGGRGNDVIFGVGGSNKINGSRGHNVLVGGSGDDRISGGPGSDVIVGGAGDNNIEGGPGLRRGTQPPGQNDLVDTGSVLVGGPGSNSISGGPSTDYILAGGFPSGVLTADDVPQNVNAGQVNALLHAPPTTVTAAKDRVATAAQARRWALRLLGETFSVRGTTLNRDLAGRLCRAAESIPDGSGNNIADGSRGDDLIVGGLGHDQLKAGRGDDILCVPDGDNVLEATTGNNELHGGAGNDRLVGGPGHDWLTGGGGENYLEAGGGKNLLIGGVGSDVLAGGQTGELLVADGGPPSGDAGIYLRDGVTGFVRVALPGSDPLTIGDWAPLVAGPPPDSFDFTVTGLYEETDAEGFIQELGKLSACRSSAQVLGNGRVDLEGNGSATANGRFKGHLVAGGLVQDIGGGNFNGVLAGAPVRDGRVDLDGDGSNGPAGRLEGAGIGYLEAGRANCVLGGDARDAIFGGPASDHIHAGLHDDFVDAGPGENLVRGGPGHTVLFGGPHSNTIFGDSGDDAIFGGPSADVLDGGPGDDYVEGNQGDDELRGGAGDDVLIGGSSGTADDVYRAAGPGDTGPRAWWDTDLSSPSGNDTLFGEAGDDLAAGDNLRIEADGRLAWWEPGDEDAWLDAATGTDPAFPAGDDECPGPVFGGCDLLHGGNGENVLIGGLGDDVLHAGTDHSYLFGDLTWFWPTADAVDTWLGGQPAWHGVLFGDLAGSTGPPVWWDVVAEGSADDDPPYAVAPSDPGGATHWPGGAARYDALLAAPNVGGDDHLVGGPGDDHLYAGAGDDVLEGGAGDDYLEGGPGDDRLYGETEALALVTASAAASGGGLGATVEGLFSPRGGLLSLSSGASPGNDLIGGSSAVHPDAADPDGSGASSGRDIIVGADDEDVMLGDNGEIRRLVDGASPGNPGAWAVDAITGGRARDVEPYDLHRLADGYRIDPGKPGSGALGTLEDAALDGPGGLDGARTLGGDDVIVGVDGRNRAYGGPGDDYIRGGPGDDYAEGGPGDDWLEGGGGDDDLIGGGSFAADDSARALDTGTTDLGTEGFPSGANVVLGQGGQNVLAGDNARVLRADPADPATVGAEDFDTYLATDGRFVGFTTPRWVSLLDLDDPMEPTIGGDDLLSAGPGNSLLFGQGGDDWASGGAGDDYAEGNAGDDVLLGDRPFGITPDGDEATATAIATADLLAERPTIARRGHTLEAFRWPADQRADDRYRNTRVGDTGGTPIADLEGLADEVAAIGDGQDDLIGGNSRPALPAGDDTIYGDGGDDFALGDNAEVLREVDGDAYVRYDERYDPAFAGARTIVRRLIEFDVGASLGCGEADAAWDCDDLARPWGDDFLDGGLGDDTLHGQDGDDELWGSPHHDEIGAPGTAWGDHLVGGLGDDRLYGGPGNDVLVGDRGSIITRYLTDNARRVTFTASGPPFMNFAGREQGDLVHEIDLYCKEDRSGPEPRFFAYGPDGCALGGSDGLGDPDNPIIIGALHSLRYSHHTFGGNDLLRGGPGDTVIYGGGGNDVLQGDEGADMLFGGRGSNVLYGGEGEPGVDSTRPADYARANDRDHVDWLFGGRGESTLDYRPRVRPGQSLGAGWADPAARLDPGLWFELTRPYWHPDVVDDATFAALRDPSADLGGVLGPAGTADGTLADVAMTARPQHHQGVTWAYGGWGRKVHQLSVSSNPPDPGDRFMDVVGNFNLFTHCPPHYGSDNLSRELRPHTDEVVHLLAVIGGAGPDLATVRTPGTSGFDQIAFIHPRIDGSMQANTGAAFRDVQLTWGADLPGIQPVEDTGVTPGHRYDVNIACPGGGGVVP